MTARGGKHGAGRPSRPGDGANGTGSGNGNGNEPGARGEDAAPTERFADLIGDARRIDEGRRTRTGALRPAGEARRLPIPRAKPGASTPDRDPGGSRPPAFRWRDPATRHVAAAPGVSDRELTRLARGEPEPDERIDLHGTRVAEAERLLARRIGSAQARGLRCVLVVHGRGRGSATNDAPLRDAVPDWLTRGETGRRVLAFAQAPRHQGGEGATLVLLRKAEGEPGR